MTGISRTALFGKLNRLAYQAIESATTFCKMRGNPYVELVHWLHQIFNLQDSDLHRISRHFDLNQAQLARDLTEALNRLPLAATGVQDFSAHVEAAIEQGWMHGTLLFNDACVRSGYLLVGILETRNLARLLESISREFAKIGRDTLMGQFNRIVAGSPEDKQHASDGTRIGRDLPQAAAGRDTASIPGQTNALGRYSQDLTEKARLGELDPVVGRESEVRRIIDILMRRRQNNPILTGEAGVGKTAVVEGLAQRIAAGDVPPALANVSLRALDLGLLQAGAGYKGEFEKRLHQVIDEVQASERPVILFIDEAHTLIGAGGAAGTGDAANLLKPALARGTLRTIAATTWAEYKKYVEKDPALSRRFQVIQIQEPDEPEAVMMMRGMADIMEAHHGVQILDEALTAAVRLSHRYIPARQLPDKAVSLLDTTCARVAVSQHAVPAAMEDCRRRIAGLETELERVRRDACMGARTADRQSAVIENWEQETGRLRQLEERWETEKALVGKILAIRAQLRRGDDAARAGRDDPGEPPPAPGPEAEGLRAELIALQAELQTIQGEAPLILPTVDAQAVAAVAADWTGIPLGRMVKSDIDTVLHLPEVLKRRIIGQDHALDMIAMRIRTARARLDTPEKPIGVFLLAGPSGVGKTETALALAESLYGGEQNLITINMSEFQEAHTVSTLKGAPPGYAGYGRGGVLTEAVRRKPYSVILLDEVEKAHRDVHEIFFQVFDKGRMEDAEGRRIDFKNTLILLTTNVGAERIAGMCRDREQPPGAEALADACRAPLLSVFPAALLGRLVVIPYYPLSDAVLGDIVTLQLQRIARRLDENHHIDFAFDTAVVRHIVAHCTTVESGGRMIDAILTNSILPAMSTEILTRQMTAEAVARVRLSVSRGGFDYEFQ